LAILDQEQERLQVLSPDGKRLAAIRALDDAPRVRPGIRLEHQQGGLRLELLRISRYAGRPPPEVNADAPRIHLTDGTVVYGNVTRYDAAERQFIVQTGAGERTIAVDQIENVFLMGAKQKRSIEVAPLPPATPPLLMATARVVCVDGTRLSGQFAGIAGACLQLNSPAMAEPVALRVDGLHEVRFTFAGARVRETPLPFPLLQADGLKLHGKIVPGKAQAGESCLAWQPSGSSTSSPLRAGVSGRIGFSGRIAGPMPAQGAVPGAAPGGGMAGGGMGQGGMAMRQRRVARQAAPPQPAAQPVAPPDGAQRRPRRGGDEERDTLFLRTGDALPCRVLAIDDRGVSLKSPFSDAIVAPHEWVRAIEFGPEASPPQLDPDKLQRLLTLPRAQKFDPPTHVVGATTGDYLRGKLRSMDERTLRFEIHGKERELSRERIARLVWLQSGEDDEAAEPPPGCVQAVRLDGVRLTFKAEEVTDEWIAGQGDLLGPCRARFDQLRELLFGNRVRRAALKLEYSWRLVDAQTPLAFRGDAAAGGTSQEGADSPLVGQAAIDFELPLLDGSKFRLSQLRGKIVVLDFWASWCGPCMQGLPKVAAVAGGHPEAEVKLVAVNLQETSAEAADALRRLKLDIAVALDRDGKVAKEYGATNIPYTLIIGADGKVARVFVGTGPQLERQLAEALAQIRKAAN
jgi:peroxiredoxin